MRTCPTRAKQKHGGHGLLSNMQYYTARHTLHIYIKQTLHLYQTHSVHYTTSTHYENYQKLTLQYIFDDILKVCLSIFTHGKNHTIYMEYLRHAAVERRTLQRSLLIQHIHHFVLNLPTTRTATRTSHTPVVVTTGSMPAALHMSMNSNGPATHQPRCTHVNSNDQSAVLNLLYRSV